MIDLLNNLSGAELVALAAIISVLMSDGLDADDIDTLGNFFTALGTNLTTIASSGSNTVIPSDT